jgi:hypothetical protein
VMTKDEVDAIRKRSKASGSGPWVTDYNEMAKKTVVRRASKKWPLDAELAEAVNNDGDSLPKMQAAPPMPSFAPVLPALPEPEPAPASDDGDLGPQPAPQTPQDAPPAPEPVQAAPKPQKPVRGPSATPQSVLEAEVISAGHTFARFIQWAEATDIIKDATSYADFSQIPKNDCLRALQFKADFLKALAEGV